MGAGLSDGLVAAGAQRDPVIEAGVEGVFGSLSFVDLVDDVLDEVGVSVGDDGLVVGGLGFFAGPGGLSGGRSRSRRVPEAVTQSRRRWRASAKSRCHPRGAEPFYSGS